MNSVILPVNVVKFLLNKHKSKIDVSVEEIVDWLDNEHLDNDLDDSCIATRNLGRLRGTSISIYNRRDWESDALGVHETEFGCANLDCDNCAFMSRDMVLELSKIEIEND